MKGIWEDMGVTISCKKTGRSIDMGSGGFWNLRNKVADLAGVGGHYRQIEIIERAYFMQDESKKKAFEEYDQKTNQMIIDGILNEKVARFLYSTDVGAKLPYGVAKKLLEVIGDHDDNIIYGYCGLPNAARFKDFKAILQDCVDTKSCLLWD